MKAFRPLVLSCVVWIVFSACSTPTAVQSDGANTPGSAPQTLPSTNTQRVPSTAENQKVPSWTDYDDSDLKAAKATQKSQQVTTNTEKEETAKKTLDSLCEKSALGCLAAGFYGKTLGLSEGESDQYYKKSCEGGEVLGCDRMSPDQFPENFGDGCLNETIPSMKCVEYANSVFHDDAHLGSARRILKWTCTEQFRKACVEKSSNFESKIGSIARELNTRYPQLNNQLGHEHDQDYLKKLAEFNFIRDVSIPEVTCQTAKDDGCLNLARTESVLNNYESVVELTKPYCARNLETCKGPCQTRTAYACLLNGTAKMGRLYDGTSRPWNNKNWTKIESDALAILTKACDLGNDLACKSVLQSKKRAENSNGTSGPTSTPQQ